MTSPEGILLDGLKSMVFYDQRFAKPLIGSHDGMEGAPYQYLSGLLQGIPAKYHADAARLALLQIIKECDQCPSPRQVRLVVAEAALKAQQLDFASLYERAKLFLSFPPASAAAAAEWINKVIFGAVRHMGRDRFQVADAAAWSAAVADVIFGDAPLVEYEVRSAEAKPEPTHRDFKKLLDPGE